MPTILPGDNRASLAALAENSIDAVVTDPPYSLTSITKRFGKDGSAEVSVKEFYGKDGVNKGSSAYSRVSGGFMGKSWDATGIERDPEFWSAVYRVLKPGAFVFAFAGARTGHWQACAMEQAGFVMHPMHAWIYGQGFPKGHDASKAIDKHLGVEGGRIAVGAEVVKFKPGATLNRDGGNWHRDEDDETVYQPHEYLPGSLEAQQWDGWKYGTQTQKPAMEPIYLAQKPYDGKPVESILRWGVGAFNIDGCRVSSEPRPVHEPTKRNGAVYGSGLEGSSREDR
jgi:site-specific DNA-methyltransferase (adenine-specific)